MIVITLVVLAPLVMTRYPTKLEKGWPFLAIWLDLGGSCFDNYVLQKPPILPSSWCKEAETAGTVSLHPVKDQQPMI